MITEYRYLDIIWLDNVLMNFVLLWITKKVVRIGSSLWRVWLAAALGALYAVLMFLPGFEQLARFALKIALSLAMILVAFPFHSVGIYLKILVVFYGTTFIFGGAALGLYYFGSNAVSVENGVFIIRNYPVKLLLTASLVIVTLFRSIWLFIRSKFTKEDLVYQVEIQFGESCVMVNALLDTGNALCDPITQNPVIVVEFGEIRHVIPEEIQAIFIQREENNLEYVTQAIAGSKWLNRFRMIPFTALGKPNGILIGFKPDRVRIRMKEAYKDIGDTVVGVYNCSLSKDSDYHALIHPEIINS